MVGYPGGDLDVMDMVEGGTGLGRDMMCFVCTVQRKIQKTRDLTRTCLLRIIYFSHLF